MSSSTQGCLSGTSILMWSKYTDHRPFMDFNAKHTDREWGRGKMGQLDLRHPWGSYAEIICNVELLTIDFSAKVEKLDSKIRGLAPVDNAKILICKKYVFYDDNSFAVTDEGIYLRDLFGFFLRGEIGAKSRLALAGKFLGLETMKPFTDFPILLTTTKEDSCCFLELRGSRISKYMSREILSQILITSTL